MQVRQAGALRYYTFDSFHPTRVAQAVFARHGGQSPEPYASLNLSISTGDTRDNVRANRTRAFVALGRDPASVADLWQVHSAEVVVADTPNAPDEHKGKADALITDRPEVTLFLRFADCVPILLYDPRRPAVGIVHAGWRGTLARAVTAAVEAMTTRYGTRPRDIVAGIGPSIGPCHYAVGQEVVAQARQAFSEGQDEILVRVNGGHHLDLWAANAWALRETGVEQIEQGQVCTACHTEDFFSHRGLGAVTGRFGALIGLA